MGSMEQTILYVAAGIACVPISLLVAGFLYPIYAIFRKLLYVPIVRRKLLDKAIKDGRTITAYLVKERSHAIEGNLTNDGIYEFMYGGKTYRRHVTNIWELPKQITLYYQKDPRKAQIRSVFGMAENPTWVLQYLLLVVIVFVAILNVGVGYAQIYLQ